MPAKPRATAAPATSAGGPHFQPALFAFLRDLSANNHRDWFQANKKRYERDVRDPLLRFISDFAPHLQEITTALRADPRPVGGSLFRIHRDVRFSADKSPYKTHAAAQFRHKRAKDVHTPGFYLHLEPGGSFNGVGIWHPDGPVLRAIRDAIAARGDEWRAILEEPAFAACFAQEGEALQRAPKGYDPDHPHVDQLRRKDFIAVARFTDDEVTAPDFLARYAETCRLAGPYTAFLARALDLEW